MQKLKTKRAILTLLIVVILFLALVIYETFFKQNSGKGKMQTTSPTALNHYEQADGILPIQTWQNETGVQVYFIHAKELPIVDMQVIFDAGSARNPEGRPLAYFVNDLLNQGTKHKDADEIAQTFEMIGAQYQSGAYRDMATIQLRSLTEEKYLNKAVKLFAEVIATPAYDEKVIKREKKNSISTLKYQAQTPQWIAERAFYESLYQENPYGQWDLGDEKRIQSIKAKDLHAFHQQYYTRQNAKVMIVGDLSLEQANAISVQVVAKLPKGQKPEPLSSVSYHPKTQLREIPFSASQTHIMYGMPVLKHKDPDYFPLMVGNHILGGNSQNNRVFDTIRGKLGLAYSAYSYFAPLKEAGPFMMVCQTRVEARKQVRDLLAQLLDDYIEQGPTPEELEDAKLNLIGGYAMNFDSNRNMLRQLGLMAFYDLPLNYFNTYQPNIEQVTLEDIKDAFKRRIQPKQMITVMVGDRAEGALS